MVNKYVKKYTVSSFGVKEKLSVALGIVIAIILYFMFFHVDKTPYGYEEIPEDVDAYMKTADNYSRSVSYTHLTAPSEAILIILFAL